MKKSFLLVPLAIILVMSLFLVSCEDEPEIKTYTVTFLLDESDTEPFDKKTVLEGAGITDAKVPEKTDHKFLYWKTAGGNEAYELKTPVKGDLTLVAAWEVNKYTVSFMDGEEKAAEPQSVEYGKKAKAPTAPTKEGHTFSCWKKVGSSSPFDFETEVIAEDTVLAAVWDINTYTVTFKNYDDTDYATKDVLYNGKVESPKAPEHAEKKYEFLHWTADAESKEEFKFDTTPIEDNLTLYPVFGIKEFTVTFVGAEGLSSAPEPQKVAYGSYANDPNAIAKDGYIITGWTIVEGGDTPFDFSSSSIKSSITLYPIVKRILTLNFYDGEELKQTSSVESGSTFVYPANPTKAGFDFAGWKEKDKDVYIYSSTVIDRDMELEACWNKDGLLLIDENGNVNGNTTYKNDSNVTVIVIPEKIGECIPKKITKDAFSNWDNIIKVVLPPTIETIEGPEKTYTGEVGAFYGCSSLTSITIPSSVTTIGIYAFADSGLNSITINGSDTYLTIKYGAFSGCSNLKSIDFSNRKTNLGEKAFISCKGLESVILNGSFSGQDHFTGCTALKRVEIKKGLTDIRNNMFKGCTSLSEVIIPDSLTIIWNNAFEGCSNLQSITLPDSVKSIYSNAFAGTGLTSITIPSSVTSIGDQAFSSCSSLQTINVDSDNTAYKSDNGILFDKDGKTIVCYPAGKGSYTIPDGVTTIGKYAFEGCSNLKTIVLEKVQNINNYAFYGSGLTSITVPSSVTSIGDKAFYNCPSLFQITIQKTKDAITDEPWGGNKVISGNMVVNKKPTVSVTWTGDTGNQ